MSDTKIENMLKEAEIYHSQGLLVQAGEKYMEILEKIKADPGRSGDKQLLEDVAERIQAVQKDQEEIENENDTPQLSEEHQDLIRNIFSYSKSKNMAALEGAMALVDFGQYEQALAEFQMLLGNEMIPKMIVAKNILRCHVILASPRTAIEQIKEWTIKSYFSRGELAFLRDFLKDLMKGEEDIEADIDTAPDYQEQNKKTKRLSEIYSVRVRLGQNQGKGNPVDFDVSYQAGNTVSFRITSDSKDMLSRLNPGDRLDLVQCYSSRSLLNTSGIISNKKKITSGPRKGDYSVELTINDL